MLTATTTSVFKIYYCRFRCHQVDGHYFIGDRMSLVIAQAHVCRCFCFYLHSVVFDGVFVQLRLHLFNL